MMTVSGMTLKEIVRDEDLISLERYSLKRGKYKLVIQDAEEQGVNLDHLEELLWRIS